MINYDNFKNDIQFLIDENFYEKEIEISEIKFSTELNLHITTIVNQLMKGSKAISEKLILDMAKALPQKLEKIVFFRWNGINNIFNSELDSAEKHFNDALKLSKKNRIEGWIKKDILNDLVYLERLKAKRNGNFLFPNDSIYFKSYKEVDNWKHSSPVNNLLLKSYSNLETEWLTYQTDVPTTKRYGGNLVSTLENLLLALITAVSIGSYTLIHHTREKLAYILYQYSKVYNHDGLVIKAMKFFIIENKSSTIEKIIDSDWSLINKYLITDPMSWINCPLELGEFPENKKTKLILISKLGSYLSKEEISSQQDFLKESLNLELKVVGTESEIKKNAMEALKEVINRLNKVDILSDLITLVEKRKLLWDDFIEILQNIDWDDIGIEWAEKTVAFLNKYRASENLNRLEIYLIFVEINLSYPNCFKKFNLELFEEWKQKKSYFIALYFSQIENLLKSRNLENSLGNEDLKIMTDFLLDNIKTENSTIKENSSISFGLSTFQMLSNLISSDKQVELKKLFSVFMEVLQNPYQIEKNKRECVDAIIRISKKKDSKLKNFATEMSQKINLNYKHIIKLREDNFFLSQENERLELKIYELLIQTGNDQNIEQIISKCLEYGTNSSVEIRNGSLLVINELSKIKTITENENGIFQYIYSASFDNWYIIRGQAIVFLNSLLHNHKNWEEICINRTKKLMKDSNTYVRSSVIYACQEQLKKNFFREQYIEILDLASRDPHHIIKEKAINLLKEYT